MRKTFYAGLITLLAAFAVSIAIFSFSLGEFLATPLNTTNKAFDYVLEPGTSIKTLAGNLQQLGLLKKQDYFIFYAYIIGTSRKLKAGEYLFQPGITTRSLLEQIISGKMIYRHFTLVEGFNFLQMMNRLDINHYVDHQLNDNVDSTDIMNKLGFPLRNPEGLFFPDTYHFTKGTSDITLLQNAYQQMSKMLIQDWQQRAPNLPYQTPYQALIVASLVEKETAQPSERPLVAGVIIHRLQKKMLLQIDSSVIYGLGQRYTGKLTKQDLKIDTPYNTYLHKGLPPTPISMPSEQSLIAALHPVVSNSLYFVAKDNNSHQFSTSLKEQNKAVKNYQINMTLPKVGKRLNNKTCVNFWYLSSKLVKLFNNHC